MNILSLILIVFSLVIPAIKIKKMQESTFSKRLLINLGILIILAFISIELLIIYICFFLMIELLYYLFCKIKYNIPIFDRIVITSLVITSLMYLLYVMNADKITAYYTNEAVTTAISKMNQMTTEQFNNIIAYSKRYFLSTLFIWSIVYVYITYRILDSANYINWDLSYLWLLLFIIPVFLDKFLIKDNYYITNLIKIGRIIFITYGMKCIYKALIDNFDKRFKTVFNLLSFYIVLGLPLVAFILGGICSFYKDILNFKNRRR